MFKKLWLTVTGDWGSREVHDTTTFYRWLLGVAVFALFAAALTSVPSCHKQTLPSHIYTNGAAQG